MTGNGIKKGKPQGTTTSRKTRWRKRSR